VFTKSTEGTITNYWKSLLHNIAPGVSFSEALQNKADQPQQQAHTRLAACQNITEQPLAPTPPKQQQTGRSKYREFASRQHIPSRNRSAANYDRTQWCCVRGRENNDHYKNCNESHETNWPVEFTGPSIFNI
jgi:hypothetical protein